MSYIEKSKSFIVLPADRVREMAQAALKRVLDGRVRDEREHVEAAMNERNKSRYARWFRLKPWTYADALAYVESITFGEIGWIRSRYWKQENIAKQHINAAATTTGDIHVNLYDLHFLTP